MIHSMKKTGRARALALIAMLGVLAVPAASRAAMVEADGPLTVFETSAVVSGRQTSTGEFTIPFAGLVTITLSDLQWPARLASLSFRLATACQTLVDFKVPGTFTFALDTPGKFFASISAKADRFADLGRYSLQVTLSAPPSPVPLPAGAFLLLSGLGGLATLCGRRGKTAAVSQSL